MKFTGKAAGRIGGTILPASAIGTAGALHRFHPAVLPAILEVECEGEGFLPDGRPKILFEAHWFDRLTDGRFRQSHPTLSAPSWDRELYWGGAAEYVRLEAAMALAGEAALQSCSWGLPQILGVNHRAAGFHTVEAMVDAFCDSPVAHLNALTTFLQSRDLDAAARALRWEAFARGYNGPGFRQHRYHLRLAVAVAAHAGLTGLRIGSAGEPVRALQVALRIAGHDPGATDGALGPRTAGALLEFQAEAGRPLPEGVS